MEVYTPTHTHTHTHTHTLTHPLTHALTQHTHTHSHTLGRCWRRWTGRTVGVHMEVALGAMSAKRVK